MKQNTRYKAWPGLIASSLLMAGLTQAQTTRPPTLVPFPNEAGTAQTFSTTGRIDLNNPFFKPMGNGRSCATCHQEGQGWSISPPAIQNLFNTSAGQAPLFRLVDGANSPKAAVATLDQKRAAYSMLLTKGVIRVGLPIPSNAEFSLQKADDPYGFASAKELSMFRRPLPTTNLKFTTAVMWDGRETQEDAKSTLCIQNARPAKCFAPLDTDLLHQANSAVLGHAEAAQGLTAAEQKAIVDFEKTLFTTQVTSNSAGSLTALGAKGGPIELSKGNFYFGINDVEAGDYRSKAPFNRNVFTMFAAWRDLDRPVQARPAPGRPAPPPVQVSATDRARASIARGEQIFNNKPFNITRVAGFNDELSRNLQRATCASCHSTPNIGTHSVPRFFNTGTTDANRRTPDLPLYTLKNNATGEIVETTDPGLAMVTGKWKDIGRMKVPSLRGLESRSPYFHDGSADEIDKVVTFYDRRFRIGFSRQEAADLAAFLEAL